MPYYLYFIASGFDESGHILCGSESSWWLSSCFCSGGEPALLEYGDAMEIRDTIQSAGLPENWTIEIREYYDSKSYSISSDEAKSICERLAEYAPLSPRR